VALAGDQAEDVQGQPERHAAQVDLRDRGLGVLDPLLLPARGLREVGGPRVPLRHGLRDLRVQDEEPPPRLLEDRLRRREHLLRREAGLRQVHRAVDEVHRRRRVGAHLGDRHDRHLPQGVRIRPERVEVGPHRRRVVERPVAVPTVLLEESAPALGLRPIDRPEDVLRPPRRLEALQVRLDAVQVLHEDGGAEALGGRQGAPEAVEQVDARPDAERLAHVAGHGLAHRGVVLHPVELPDVPHVRVADRRVADGVVGPVERLAEDGVPDSGERVGPPEALLDRVRCLRESFQPRRRSACRTSPRSSWSRSLPRAQPPSPSTFLPNRRN
jgi:hypothetical protein